jgi:hypothetical protein
MEYEETRRPGLIGYDERTETWYVRSADSQRLMLTRQSLTHLVEMYNSVYSGRPMALVEERELRRLRDGEAGPGRSVTTPAPRRSTEVLGLTRFIRRLVTRHRRNRSPNY